MAENIGLFLIYTLLNMSKMDGVFINYVIKYYLFLSCLSIFAVCGGPIGPGVTATAGSKLDPRAAAVSRRRVHKP